MNPLYGSNARKFDLFDCLVYGGGVPYSGPPDRGPLPVSSRLFGNSNVGNLSLSNMQVGGMMPGDSSALVTNWYARTNIPEGPMRDAMTQKVICTMIVGCQPQPGRQVTLRELLNRPAGVPLESHPDAVKSERTALVEAMTDSLYEAYLRGEEVTGGDVAEQIANKRFSISDRARKDMADPAIRERWLRVAAAAIGSLRPDPVVVIPLRQNFSVQADVFGVHEEFNRYIRRLDEPNWNEHGERVHHLQRPPEHPSDRPGIWVHLEGWLVPGFAYQ